MSHWHALGRRLRGRERRENGEGDGRGARGGGVLIMGSKNRSPRPTKANK